MPIYAQSSTLRNLTIPLVDVDHTTLTQDQVLQYNATTGKFENQQLSLANADFVLGGISLGTGENIFIRENPANVLEFKSIVAGDYVTLTSTGTELTITAADQSMTASNLAGGVEVFSGKVVDEFQFRTLFTGTNNINLTVSQNGDKIEFVNTAEINTASNVGAGEAVFVQKTDYDLEFRSLTTGTNNINLTVATDNNEIKFVNTAEINTASNVGAGEAVFVQKTDYDLEFRSLTTGTNNINLTVTTDNNEIEFVNTAEINTASNLGAGEAVFVQKTDYDLEFRSLTTATGNINLTVTTDNNEIKFLNTAEINTASNLGAGEAVFAQKTDYDLEFKSIVAGRGVTLTSTADTITVDSAPELVTIVQGVPDLLTPQLGDLITYDIVTGKYKLFETTDELILGTVAEIIAPDTFKINPAGELIDTVIAGTGPYYYFDNNNPGKVTDTLPTLSERRIPVFFKLSGTQAIYFDGGSNGGSGSSEDSVFSQGTLTVENGASTFASYKLHVLYNTTTDNTPTELFSDGASTRITLTDDTTMMFEADIVGRESTGTDHCAFRLQGVIDKTNATTVVINTVNETVVAQTDATWVVSVTADDINDAIAVTVTGNNDTIRWTGFVKTVVITH